jgi:hypothetical protein
MSPRASKQLKEYGHVLYKIYTEDAHRKALIRALQRAEFPALPDSRLPGFTLIPAVGYGEGQSGNMESSLVCDVIVPYSDETDEKMQTVAEDIRRENADQAVVLIVRVPCIPELVCKKESKNQDQGALPFAIEDAQEIRLTAELGLDWRQSLAKEKVGKIVARIGKWKKLLQRNKELWLRSNSRDLVEFQRPVLRNLMKQARAGG